MMKRAKMAKWVLFTIALSVYCYRPLPGQRVINVEEMTAGEISLAPDIAIPKILAGYTLWLPRETPIGMIVFTHPRRDTLNSDSLIDYAQSKGLAVLYATTDNRLEFFFRKEKMQEIENYVHQVIQRYHIPSDHLLYCGMALEGTRALKLTIFGQDQASKNKLKPRAIVICDAPLDMLRFHQAMIRAKKVNFSDIAVNEGTWVSAYLEANLGGKPTKNPATYIQYSPYCYTAEGGPHLSVFQDIAVRAYTEPDIHWWMQERRKDYYGMNALDLAAFINDLQLRGNSEAALITTQHQGYRPDGSRHPHSWSIVDEKEMVNWFLGLIGKD